VTLEGRGFAMTEEVVISLKKVTKAYKISALNAFEAVKNIDLDIKKGEFTVIMGPSGAGKSTLLYFLSTLDLPTHGEVQIFGQNILKMTEDQINQFRYGHLGYVFQDFQLIETMTNLENMSEQLSMHHESTEEIRRRLNIIAEKLDITEILDKYPQECSGGQQQRVAIGRALMTLPQIIIADEPTGNLDSQNSLVLMKLLRLLNQEGKTIVMVTHDCMIASFAKRVLYLLDGQIVGECYRHGKSQQAFFQEIIELNQYQTQRRQTCD